MTTETPLGLKEVRAFGDDSLSVLHRVFQFTANYKNMVYDLKPLQSTWVRPSQALQSCHLTGDY